MKKPCSIPGCTRPLKGRGWCNLHWQHWYYHGDPLYVRPDFWSYVKKTEGCWLWIGGAVCGDGKYGKFRGMGAHRHSWILANGPIPKIAGADARGTCVLHHCDNGKCVRPDHLFIGTHVDNMNDMMAKERLTPKYKTLCKHGHPRNETNSHVTKKGLKSCRVCAKLRTAKYRAACSVVIRT